MCSFVSADYAISERESVTEFSPALACPVFSQSAHGGVISCPVPDIRRDVRRGVAPEAETVEARLARRRITLTHRLSNGALSASRRTGDGPVERARRPPWL